MLNQVIHDSWVLPVVCTEPAAPSGGDPIRFGFLTGVAVDDENAAGVTVVDFGQRVWDLSVKDDVGGGIAVGDTLFYDSATDALDNDTGGTPFGYALEVVGIGATTVINVLHVPGHGAATLGAGVIAAANIAANAVEAAAIKADAVTTAKILNANVTAAKLAAESVTGAKAAESANADVLGAVPLLYHASIADASADTDIVVTSKIRVVDFWILNKGAAAHAANDVVTLKNGADAISNAVAKTAATDIIVRATTLDDSKTDIADGGTMKFTAVKDTNVACEAYVLAYRIA
jgi:hypothetical protein